MPKEACMSAATKGRVGGRRHRAVLLGLAAALAASLAIGTSTASASGPHIVFTGMDGGWAVFQNDGDTDVRISDFATIVDGDLTESGHDADECGTSTLGAYGLDSCRIHISGAGTLEFALDGYAAQDVYVETS
jgi:hypothetical protein